MQKTAAVFPGQGSQRTGMGIDFFNHFSESKEIFNCASDILKIDIKQICETENDNRLHQTEFTQPCILTAEYAMFKALKKNFEFNPEYFGGHSLGEYTALVAAEVIPFETAIELVHMRGKLMQWSMSENTGAMAAVIREEIPLPYTEIKELAASENIDIANDNSPYQLVLSGMKKQVDKISEHLKEKFKDSNFRIVNLITSASFHSRYMIEAENIYSKIIASKANTFHMDNAKKVTSNFTGGFHSDSVDELVNSLTRQISGLVRWQDNMKKLAHEAQKIYEIGPNRPLSGFFNSIGNSISAIIDLRTAKRYLSPVVDEAIQ